MATPDTGRHRRRLTDAIAVLDQAANRIWEHGGGTEPWQSLGLGVYLAQAQVAALMAGCAVISVGEPHPPGQQQTVAELLTTARHLCGTPTGVDGEPTVAPALVAQLDALIDEAAVLGC
ncbi:MAG: hypothetical protein U0R78_14205 [Nocardioidaceae bacterium]